MLNFRPLIHELGHPQKTLKSSFEVIRNLSDHMLAYSLTSEARAAMR